MSLEISALDLARKVVTNELRVQNEEHSHWMYRLEKARSGWRQIQEILETNDGSLSQLLSIDGHPLDAKQLQKENQRIQRLVSHPDEQRKLQQASNRRTEQAYSGCVMKRNTSVVWSLALNASIVGVIIGLILKAFRIWGNKWKLSRPAHRPKQEGREES